MTLWVSSHCWGGLFAQLVTMLLSSLRFEATCARRHSVSLRLGYGHFDTSTCFFFRHSCFPTRIFLQREETRLRFVFKRVLTPCFVDQSVCSPDFYLETQIKVGLPHRASPFAEVQVPPRCSFTATPATLLLLRLKRSAEMAVIASFLQMQGVKIFLQNASGHVLQVRNRKWTIKHKRLPLVP